MGSGCDPVQPREVQAAGDPPNLPLPEHASNILHKSPSGLSHQPQILSNPLGNNQPKLVQVLRQWWILTKLSMEFPHGMNEGPATVGDFPGLDHRTIREAEGGAEGSP